MSSTHVGVVTVLDDCDGEKKVDMVFWEVVCGVEGLTGVVGGLHFLAAGFFDERGAHSGKSSEDLRALSGRRGIDGGAPNSSSSS